MYRGGGIRSEMCGWMEEQLVFVCFFPLPSKYLLCTKLLRWEGVEGNICLFLSLEVQSAEIVAI